NKRVKVVIRNRFIRAPPVRGCVSAPSGPSEGRRPAKNAYSPAPRLIAEGSCENFTGGRLRKRRKKADRKASVSAHACGGSRNSGARREPPAKRSLAASSSPKESGWPEDAACPRGVRREHPGGKIGRAHV